MSTGTILFEDTGNAPGTTGKFVNPFIDWSASINTSTNQVTITAVFKAYTTGTLRNFSDRFAGTIVIGGRTKNLGPYPVSIAVGGSTVVTTIDSHTETFNLNNDGSGSFALNITGGNPGTSWTATTLLAGQNNVLSFDYARPPSAVSVSSFSRGSNGTTVALTSSTSTFYGSGAYYAWRWSNNGGSTWSDGIVMSGTSGSGSGFTSTDTILVQVIAVDSEGNSGWSASSSIQGVPAAPGDAPTLTRTADGASITLTSATATRASTYDYRESKDGSTWDAKVDIASGRAVTITGLTYDQIYYYQTRATNNTGDGAWSATRSINGVAPSFSGSGTDTTVASPAIWGLPYTDGVTALRVRNYSVVPNTLPAGLNLNTGTGAITGTPTSTTTFSSTFTITANNNAGTATTSATIAVISPVRVNTVDAGPTGPASFATGAVNVLTVTGPTASFKTGIVRVWNGSTFVPSRLA